MCPPTLPELLAQSLRSACGGAGAPALSWPSLCARYASRKTSATLGHGVLLHNTAKQMRSRTCNRLSHLLRCNARSSRPQRHLNVHKSRGLHSRDKEHAVYEQPKCSLFPVGSLFAAESLHKQPVERRVEVASFELATSTVVATVACEFETRMPLFVFYGTFCVFLHVCASCYAVVADRPSWHALLSTVCPTCIHTGFHSEAFACHAVICALFLGKTWMNPLHHFIVMVTDACHRKPSA